VSEYCLLASPRCQSGSCHFAIPLHSLPLNSVSPCTLRVSDLGIGNVSGPHTKRKKVRPPAQELLCEISSPKRRTAAPGKVAVTVGTGEHVKTRLRHGPEAADAYIESKQPHKQQKCINHAAHYCLPNLRKNGPIVCPFSLNSRPNLEFFLSFHHP
jgi:hypothetical protein